MLSLDNLPNFYHTLLVYLQDLNSIITADDNVLEKIIWNNQNIVINGKSIFFIVPGLTKTSLVSAA